MNFLRQLWLIIPVGVWLALSATAVVFGDYFAKRWSIDRGPVLFWGSVACYALSSQLYLPTLLRQGLVISSILWVVLSTAGFLFIGTVLFHEHLSALQWTGVGFGILSIFLLSLP